MCVCPKCGEAKPLGHFNRWKRQCKECRAAIQRDYVNRQTDVIYKRNKTWRDGGGRRRSSMNQYNGMTPERYDSMLESQGFVCAVCHKETCARDGRGFAVDHCHETGVVRGLLCTNCNVGLAQFEDDIDRLDAARAYLARVQDH